MWQLRDTDSGEVVQAFREHDVLELDALTVTADQRALTLAGAAARVNDVPVELPYGLRPGDLLDTGTRRLRVEQDSAATLLRDSSQWWLVGISEEVAGLRIPIADELIVIGREEDCDVVLDEGHVSRHHAHIERLNDGVWLTDLASRNGTFVNDERLRGACRLHGGEELRFDETRFMAEREAPEPHAEVDPEDPNRTLIRPPSPVQEVPGDGDSEVPPAAGQGSPDLRRASPRADTAGSSEPDPHEAGSSPLADQPTVVTSAVPFAEQPTMLDVPAATPERASVPSGPAPGESHPSESTIAATVQMENAGQPVMIVNGGPIHGRVIPIRPGRVTIGRSGDCDIVIPERSVSSRHAQLEYRPPRDFIVSNLISSNGVFVNGTRVESAQLSSGDVVSIGRVELLFAEDAPAARRLQRQFIDPPRGLPNWVYAILAFAATIGVMAAGFFAVGYLGYWD